ncbi:MAG: hypothetical protein H0Z28_11120 [Archaeoglobus sp.]|nr:hypothetical protein [Archaeoglobus sp.]
MSLNKEIAEYWQRLEKILAFHKVQSLESFKEEVINGILNILEEEDLEDIDRIERKVRDIFKNYRGKLSRDLQKELSRKIQKSIKEAFEFYKDKGVECQGVYESVRRSKEAKDLTRFFQNRLKDENKELEDTTLEIIKEQIAKGEINRRVIEDKLISRADTFINYIKAESHAVVSGYYQLSNEKIADKAGLEYRLYYGAIGRNSRPFCRAHVGKVFSMKQIEKMRNGILEPVKIHRGGYNCRHIWQPVDPEWDNSLKPVKASAKTIEIGNARRITVFVNKAQAERLKKQITLQRRGYKVFYDSEVNDRGFIALHDSWIRKVRFDKYGNISGNFEVEFDVGEKLSDLGYVVEFNRNIKNYHGGAVDIVVNGKKMEIKTPEVYRAKTIWNRISKSKDKNGIYQSDYYIINLREELEESEFNRLKKAIVYWQRRHEEKRIFILFNFGKVRFEEIKHD